MPRAFRVVGTGVRRSCQLARDRSPSRQPCIRRAGANDLLAHIGYPISAAIEGTCRQAAFLKRSEQVGATKEAGPFLVQVGGAPCQFARY